MAHLREVFVAADVDQSKSLSYAEFSELAKFLKARAVDESPSTLMLRVWEEINALEDIADGDAEDDASTVVSPDAFAIAFFQNGL